jgi:hypothetical protein
VIAERRVISPLDLADPQRDCGSFVQKPEHFVVNRINLGAWIISFFAH